MSRWEGSKEGWKKRNSNKVKENIYTAVRYIIHTHALATILIKKEYRKWGVISPSQSHQEFNPKKNKISTATNKQKKNKGN